MTRFESIISFPYGIPCKFDIFGSEFQIEVNGVIGTIAFPCLPTDFIEKISNPNYRNNLIKPLNADPQIVKFLNHYEWGIYRDKNGNGNVNSISLWFDCEYSNCNETVALVQDRLFKYIDKFLLFLETLTFSNFNEFTCGLLKFDRFTQFWMWNDSKILVQAGTAGIKIIVPDFSKHVFISKNIVDEAIKYANFNYEISLPFKLIRDAIEHKNNKNYRRAILDSSTAIEISLTKRIEEELKIKNIIDPKLNSILLKKFHSLGGRIELIEALNIELPRPKKDYLDFISKLRNKAIHSGYLSNDDEVQKFIEIAQEIVIKFSE